MCLPTPGELQALSSRNHLARQRKVAPHDEAASVLGKLLSAAGVATIKASVLYFSSARSRLSFHESTVVHLAILIGPSRSFAYRSCSLWEAAVLHRGMQLKEQTLCHACDRT